MFQSRNWSRSSTRYSSASVSATGCGWTFRGRICRKWSRRWISSNKSTHGRRRRLTVGQTRGGHRLAETPAIDAVTQARRLGAPSATVIYHRAESDLPAYHFEYELAKADGAQFIFNAAVLEILAEDGRTCPRCDWPGTQGQCRQRGGNGAGQRSGSNRLTWSSRLLARKSKQEVFCGSFFRSWNLTSRARVQCGTPCSQENQSSTRVRGR